MLFIFEQIQNKYKQVYSCFKTFHFIPTHGLILISDDYV